MYLSNNLRDKLEFTGYFLMKLQALWVMTIDLLQLNDSLNGLVTQINARSHLVTTDVIANSCFF